MMDIEMVSDVRPERPPAGSKGRTKSFSCIVVPGPKISEVPLTDVGVVGLGNNTLESLNRSAPVKVIVAAWVVVVHPISISRTKPVPTVPNSFVIKPLTILWETKTAAPTGTAAS